MQMACKSKFGILQAGSNVGGASGWLGSGDKVARFLYYMLIITGGNP